MIKGSIYQENTIINIYATNYRAPKYIRQTQEELKVKIDSSSVIVGDFNNPFLKNGTTRQKINKKGEHLNNTIN